MSECVRGSVIVFPFLSSLNSEGLPASTRGLRIRVLELEPSSDKLIGVVQLESIEKHKRLGVDHAFDAIVLFYVVVTSDVVFRDEVHHIGHAAASTGSHTHTQTHGTTLLLCQRLQVAFGPV